MKTFKKLKKGFTLVELVVVIAVIAILAAVSVGAYFGVTESANNSKLEQEAKQVYTAIQTVALAPNEIASLDKEGLKIEEANISTFETELEKNLGTDITVTTGTVSTVTGVVVNLSTSAYSVSPAAGTPAVYKTFEYYNSEVGGKKAVADVVTGNCKVIASTAENIPTQDPSESESTDTSTEVPTGSTTTDPIGTASDPTVDPDEGKVWYLVRDSRDLSVGEKIIITAKDHDLALSTTLNKNNIAGTSIVKDGEFATINENVQIITLESGSIENTYALNIGENRYLYGGLSDNHLKEKEKIDANSSWNIFISKGSASIVSQGTGVKDTLRFNENNSNPIFSCYESGQKDVSIYKLGFYEEFECEHIFVESEPECLVCGEPNENYVEPTPEVITSISSALTANDGAKVELSGTVTRKYEYGTNSFYFSDGDSEILVFKSSIEVGIADQVKVTGEIGYYNEVAQVNNSTVVITEEHLCTNYTEASCTEPAKCTVCGMPNGTELGHTDPNANGNCDRCGTNLGEVKNEETISTFGSNGTLSNDNEVITRTGTNVVVSNEKASASSAIRTSDTDHFRCYVGSNLIIKVNTGTIKEIVFICTGTGYTIQGTATVGEFSASGTEVTLSEISDESEVTISITKQSRIKSVTVTYVA